MTELPVIDIAPLFGDDKSKWRNVADRMGAAARETGFFYVTNHGVSATQIEAAYKTAEAFFAAPEAEKQRYYIGESTNHRGYVPFTEKGDYTDEVHRNYEAFDLALDLPEEDPDYLAGNLLLGPNVWPDDPSFKRVIGGYYDAISGVGARIAAALELHLGLAEGELTGQMTKPISQLRLLHYVRDEAAAELAETVNMGAHTDYECLTLLHQRQPGLQVMTRDDEWIDAPLVDGAYAVNIGDMLEAWTNGVFRATPHRVLNTSPERFSMPYFVAANHDAVVKPFETLLTEGEGSLYQPFEAGAHLERMLLRDFPYLRMRRHDRVWNTSAESFEPILNPFEARMARAGS